MPDEKKCYEVKDTDGEKHVVTADDWECSGDGLIFFVNKEAVAWFVR